jgi:hypothetical protein
MVAPLSESPLSEARWASPDDNINASASLDLTRTPSPGSQLSSVSSLSSLSASGSVPSPTPALAPLPISASPYSSTPQPVSDHPRPSNKRKYTSVLPAPTVSRPSVGTGHVFSVTPGATAVLAAAKQSAKSSKAYSRDPARLPAHTAKKYYGVPQKSKLKSGVAVHEQDLINITANHHAALVDLDHGPNSGFQREPSWALNLPDEAIRAPGEVENRKEPERLQLPPRPRLSESGVKPPIWAQVSFMLVWHRAVEADG